MPIFKLHGSVIALLTLSTSSVQGCRKSNSFHEEAENLSIHDQDADYTQKVSDATEARAALALDAGPDFIDVRGVGSSAWTAIRAPQAPPSEVNLVLKKFDPQKKVLKGDLSFINWESGIAKDCSNYARGDAPFLSNPLAIAEAAEYGFNLFGLANDHSEDCAVSKDPDNNPVSGPVATARFVSKLAEQKNALWHGVGPANTVSAPAVKSFSLKGRLVNVIFGSVALSNQDCAETSCRNQVTTLLSQMRTTPGDLRILAIHTQGISTFDEGKNLAERFVREFSGDVVFASGPHTWAGVKVIEKATGGHGVVFHSLGNFLHNQVAPNPNNMIGRVLLDVKSLQPKQIQVIPILNNVFDVDVTYSEPGKGLPKANLQWARAHLQAHRDIPIGFANIK